MSDMVLLCDDDAEFDGFGSVGPVVEEPPRVRVPVQVTPGLLAEIEAAALAATPGPWAYDDSGVWTTAQGSFGGDITGELLPGDPADGIARVGDPYPRGDNCPTENMRHIARMDPETALALVERVRMLEEYYAASEACHFQPMPSGVRPDTGWQRLRGARKALGHA